MNRKGFRVKTVMMFCLIIIMCSLAGCGFSNMTEIMEDKACDALFEKMMDYVLANDKEGAYLLMDKQTVSQNEFYKGFSEIEKQIDFVTYDSRKLQKQTRNVNGDTTVTCIYELNVPDGRRYQVSVTRAKEKEDLLSGFYLNRQEVFYGSITDIKKYTPKQWVVLIAGFVLMLPALIGAIDCLRHKIKYKPLWLLVNLFGYGFLYIYKMQYAIGSRFGINLVNYSRLLLSDMGGFQLTIFVPIGTIVYLFMRKRMLIKTGE